MIDRSIVCNMKFMSVDDVKDEGGREIKSITKRTRILFTIYNSKLLKEKEKFWN